MELPVQGSLKRSERHTLLGHGLSVGLLRFHIACAGGRRSADDIFSRRRQIRDVLHTVASSARACHLGEVTRATRMADEVRPKGTRGHRLLFLIMTGGNLWVCC